MGKKYIKVVDVIALLSMLIDHIGVLFYPQYVIFRIIGRLAFPIFAYNISCGYLKTKNIKKYAIRLAVLALISQFQYGMLFGARLNVIFTLLLGLLIIYCYDNKKNIIFIMLMTLIPVVIQMDYGIYGISMVFLFYIFRDNKKHYIPVMLLLNLIYIGAGYINMLQIYSVAAVCIIVYDFKCEIKISRTFYRVFYPLHLAILLLFKIRLIC